jgi:hypothetical protein
MPIGFAFRPRIVLKDWPPLRRSGNRYIKANKDNSGIQELRDSGIQELDR